jgi:uncharacterized protein
MPVKFDLALDYGAAAFLLMFTVLTAKFILLSIIITHFWQHAGQTTIIAVAMHGLSNDSLRLGGEVLSEAFAAQLRYEVNLVLPMLAVVVVLVWQRRTAGPRSATRSLQANERSVSN